MLYTRVTGIWQSVWLEPVADAHVRRLRMQPDIDQGHLTLDVELSRIPAKGALRLTASFAGTEQSTVTMPLSVRHYSQCDLHPRLEQRLVLSVPRLNCGALKILTSMT